MKNEKRVETQTREFEIKVNREVEKRLVVREKELARRYRTMYEKDKRALNEQMNQ